MYEVLKKIATSPTNLTIQAHSAQIFKASLKFRTPIFFALG